MADTPEAYYRNALDLNRFGNKVQNDLRKSYNRIIVDSVEKLARINEMPLETRPKYKAARLRALLKQTTESLAKWSGKSEKTVIKELQGLAKVQVDFAVKQLEAALPAGMKSAVNSVEVSPSYAKSVVTKKATDLNASLLSDDLEAKVKGIPEKFSLTAKKGSQITLPNGEVLTKSFRGLAAKQADLFGRNIRDGLLSGETTQQMTRRLYGVLMFEGGGKATNNQISTLVKTSVQSVSNQAAQTVYEANQDITKQYKWIATLDSRTAPECRILDQTVHNYGQGPEPPQHFGCRCRTTAVLDYEALGVDPPKYKYAKRAGEGGSVPIGQSYGNWLSKQSASYKAKALGASKVKYFNALTKKYGPDQALKKLVREDGSAKTLKKLRETYGKNPSKKLTAKPKPKPKPKPKSVAKPVEFERRLVDSSPEQLRKAGRDLIKEVDGLDIEEYTKLGVEFKAAAKDSAKDFDKFQKAKDKYFAYRDKFEKQMETLRNKMLKTNLNDAQVDRFIKNTKITSWKAPQKTQIRGYLNEYIRMFNGNGFVDSANGVPAITKIGKAKRGSCKFWEGSLTTQFKSSMFGTPTTVSKSTTFHEITHAVEVANPKLNKFMQSWRTNKGFTDKEKIRANMVRKEGMSVYGPSQRVGKPVYRLKDITSTKYDPREDALVNDYMDAYMGKVYSAYDFKRFGIAEKIEATESLTMTVERFADPQKMGALYKQHPELFELIVGMSRAKGL